MATNTSKKPADTSWWSELGRVVSQPQKEEAGNFLRQVIQDSSQFHFTRPLVAEHLARAWLVQYHHNRTIAEAETLLGAAIEFFEREAFKRSTYKKPLADVKTIKAIFLHNQQHYYESLELVSELIAVERDASRKNILILNKCRTLLAKGDINIALANAVRITKKPAGDRTWIYFCLLKARIFLMLGYEAECIKAIRETQPFVKGELIAKTELRYLGLVARLGTCSRESFLKRYQDFLGWVKEQCPPGYLEFYEAEGMLYKFICHRQAISNLDHFTIRFNYLADKLDLKIFKICLKTLFAFDKRSETPGKMVARLEKILKSLLSGSHRLVATCVAYFLVERAVETRQYRIGIAMDEFLIRHFDILAAGMPAATIKRLSANESAVRKRLATLRAKIPPLFLQDSVAIDDILSTEPKE